MYRFAEFREKAGYSQKQAAMEIGVAAPTVSQWEAGVRNPSLEHLVRIAQLYAVTTDQLLGVDCTDSESRSLQITRTESDMIMAFRSLNTAGQEFVRQTLNTAVSAAIYKKHDPIPVVENALTGSR